MMPPRALVIFDMDGTLTRPQLDFDAIRREIGLDRVPLLEAVAAMQGAARARAEAILLRHETAAAACSELQDGAAEVVKAIRARGWPAALMTRNSRASVEAFIRRHDITFDLTRTREDGEIKPSPQPVLDICRALGAEPRRAWVIGDFHYDLLCGNAAGATTVLLWSEEAPLPQWAGEADHVIRRLTELLPLLGLAQTADRA